MPTEYSQPRVVIVHDFMEVYGGAERVTQEIAMTFPEAPVYAILGRRQVARRMGVADRFFSLLPPRDRILKDYRLLAPLYPALADLVRLPPSDVLISSSYAFAHHFRTLNDAPQVCYCHSPLRIAWSVTDTYRAAMASSLPGAIGFNGLVALLRAVDRRRAARVARFVTQSGYNVGEIERCYGRDATAIGVPVDCRKFVPGDGGTDGYYLLCSRLFDASKQVSFVVDAFRQLPAQRLLVAGDGPDLARLRAAAPPNVEYLGHLDDDRLMRLMQRCRALIFPSHEPFGLVAVETMACGRPVIAYAKGGALQTMIGGVTGEFFSEQSADAVARVIADFDPSAYDSARIRTHAQQWDTQRFRERLHEVVIQTAREERAPTPVPVAGRL